MTRQALVEPSISYAVERSARRTIGLYVERDGGVLVRAPQSTTDERIAAVIKAKQKWIYRAQARWAALNPQHAQREFVSGETIYFLGRPHRLDFRLDAAPVVLLEGELFILRTADRPRAESLLRDFYRSAGQDRLPELVQMHSVSMGLTPARIRIQELGHRWGSCSEAGTLNFHWKAMALPLEVLHYLVVHELAHLGQRDHSPNFWRLVEREMPDWRTHAKWLDFHGAQMTL
ncbi:MAG: M48 family metallopeptidase [Burkholderiales bacterium]|nr:M48 family metallopeptidase [Burkholderiales bacterium]